MSINVFIGDNFVKQSICDLRAVFKKGSKESLPLVVTINCLTPYKVSSKYRLLKH